MSTEPTESRMGALLRAYGVGGRISIRQAALLTGLSKETIARHLRRGDEAPRLLREPNLVKLANGLGIPADVLKDAMMADINYVRAVSRTNVTAVLGQIAQLDPDELLELQTEIARMQRARSMVGVSHRGRSLDGHRQDGESRLGPGDGQPDGPVALDAASTDLADQYT